VTRFGAVRVNAASADVHASVRPTLGCLLTNSRSCPPFCRVADRRLGAGASALAHAHVVHARAWCGLIVPVRTSGGDLLLSAGRPRGSVLRRDRSPRPEPRSCEAPVPPASVPRSLTRLVRPRAQCQPYWLVRGCQASTTSRCPMGDNLPSASPLGNCLQSTYALVI